MGKSKSVDSLEMVGVLSITTGIIILVIVFLGDLMVLLGNSGVNLLVHFTGTVWELCGVVGLSLLLICLGVAGIVMSNRPNFCPITMFCIFVLSSILLVSSGLGAGAEGIVLSSGEDAACAEFGGYALGGRPIRCRFPEFSLYYCNLRYSFVKEKYYLDGAVYREEGTEWCNELGGIAK